MVAVVEKYKTNYDYSQLFPGLDIEVFPLCSAKVDKVRVSDITLDKATVLQHDYVITVGAEAFKAMAGGTSITKYQGTLVDGKFLPISSPGLVKVRPEGMPAFTKAVSDINHILNHGASNYDTPVNRLITDAEGVKDYFANATDVLAVDTETSDFDPREGDLLLVSLATRPGEAVCIEVNDDVMDTLEECLREAFKTKTIVMHGGKFDMHWFRYGFNLSFPRNYEDTMLMHYALDENSEHDLKSLALKYTNYGDYNRELEDYKRSYCKINKIKLEDFSYAFIPADILSKYAAIDAAATYEIYMKLSTYLQGKIRDMYYSLLIRGTKFILDMESNGVPFDRDQLLVAQKELGNQVEEMAAQMYQFPEVKAWEESSGKIFNVNSVYHVRELLFDYLKLDPTGKKTGTGADSTDKEVLEELAKVSPVAELILNIKKAKKLQSTYITKILQGLNRDSRLRTGFHLHTTTSGRMSSSGKLNMQQLPRDDKTIKKCIKARPGYKIVSQDLVTGEIWVAAALSKDVRLANVFRSGQDFHSSIAHMVFKLPCEVSEVKANYSDMRQAAKSISFGILYQAGPEKIASEAGCDVADAKEYIAQYFNTFRTLDSWIKTAKKEIAENGYVYSAFGRKRRLPNVRSSDKKLAAHEVRSGVNALIQSVCSDINLLAAMDLNDWLKQNKAKSKIVALVHDSIISEVAEEELELFLQKQKYFTQLDRGVCIPGQPIGVDVSVGDTYAF